MKKALGDHRSDRYSAFRGTDSSMGLTDTPPPNEERNR